MDVLIVFICLFLMGTGGYAIIASLINTKSTSDATLEAKGFKIIAPVRLIYGLLAVASVLAVIYYHRHEEREEQKYVEQKKEEERKEEEKELKSLLKKQEEEVAKNSILKFTIYTDSVTSIFNSTVLIYLYNDSSAKLKFTGIRGVSRKKVGSYNSSEIEIQKGDRFFMLLEDSRTIYTINVLSLNKSKVMLEFYKI